MGGDRTNSKKRKRSEQENENSFESLKLDHRLLVALMKLKFTKPTPIQLSAVPLCVEGKDVQIKAPTGTGKTLAYCLPVIQRLLAINSECKQKGTQALLLVPTRELCQQVKAVIDSLIRYCTDILTVAELHKGTSAKAQRAVLGASPSIIITTPGCLHAHLLQKAVSLSSLSVLVIDEADLVYSFGYEEAIQKIHDSLPPLHQTILVSATLSDDLSALKQLVMHNPLFVEAVAEESESASSNPTSQKLAQLFTKVGKAQDKYIALCCLLKMRKITGKTLVFVSSLNECFRVKLFLDQFGLKAAVLNHELPQNSRYHTVEQFNKGIVDNLIAVDDQLDKTTGPKEHGKGKTKTKGLAEAESKAAFGVSRGVDFKHVRNVLNFDFPTTVPQYVHRAGRTARAGAMGVVLSFVLPEEEALLRRIARTAVLSDGQEAPESESEGEEEDTPADTAETAGVEEEEEEEERNGDEKEVENSDKEESSEDDEDMAGPEKYSTAVEDAEEQEENSEAHGAKKELKPKGGAEGDKTAEVCRAANILEYSVNKAQLEALRYRAEDTLRGITHNTIKDARFREIRSELITSEKLTAHFEDNPTDLEYLKHDSAILTHKLKKHLRHVPKYLKVKETTRQPSAPSTAQTSKAIKNTLSKLYRGQRGRRGGRGGAAAKKNPLKSFSSQK